VAVDRDNTDTPDLAIYSQAEKLALGDEPSWDNPEITTNHWGPFRLMEEAQVIVRNLSMTTPAVNALVHYSVSPFGIGQRRTLLQTRTISIGAAASTELRFPLDRATREGDPRVGVYIEIEHPHDRNLLNNTGAQVHDGSYTSEVGRESSLEIPVRNPSNFSKTIELTVLSSALVASIAPASLTLDPHQESPVTLQISTPPAVSGLQGATVVARSTEGELIGGVTKLLRIDS
jgi:hypothetical protein